MAAEELHHVDRAEVRIPVEHHETPELIHSELRRTRRELAITTGFFGVLTIAAGAYTTYQLGGDHQAMAGFTGLIALVNAKSTVGFGEDYIASHAESSVSKKLSDIKEKSQQTRVGRSLSKLYDLIP